MQTISKRNKPETLNKCIKMLMIKVFFQKVCLDFLLKLVNEVHLGKSFLSHDEIKTLFLRFNQKIEKKSQLL